MDQTTRDEFRRSEALAYQEHFNYVPKGDNESDGTFAERIAGRLRKDGHVVEAHELTQGCRYDSDDPRRADVTMGLMGAAALARENPRWARDSGDSRS